MTINFPSGLLKVAVTVGVAVCVGGIVNWAAGHYFALEVQCVRAPCPPIDPAWKTEITFFGAGLASLLTVALVIFRPPRT